jgi:hypothetical protein
MEMDQEAVRDEDPVRRGKALGLHRALDAALQLEWLEACSKEPRGLALEEAFEEPLDGGQRRHGRSRSLAEGLDRTFRGGGRYRRLRGLRTPCGILSALFERCARSTRPRPVPGVQMPEILTESFCERCGTRYTFESAAPRGPRLKGLKVVSRGLKNFVMSDDTSMDEAMAAARSETDREVTTHQLDAFHKTFNFCMSCRQYTCGNCWNDVEGRCLSCAPNLGHDVLAAPFPDLDAGGALTPHSGNGHTLEPANGHAPVIESPMAWPTSDLMREELAVEPQPWPVAEAEVSAAEFGVAPVDAPGVDGVAADDDDLEPIDPLARLAGLDTVFDRTPEAPSDVAAVAESVTAEPVAPEPVAAEPVDHAVASPSPIEPTDPDSVAAAAAMRTTDLLQRFRPGQNLDDAIAAYEQSLADAAELEPEPVAAAPEPEPEPVAAAPEPEPVAAAPEPEPVAAAPRDDVVAQPTWSIVAPDTSPSDAIGTKVPVTPPAGSPPEQPAAASAEPQWPTQPQWPSQRPSAGLPFLGRPAEPTGGIEALWAESAREVVSVPADVASRAAGGVQPCVSCGLSLSANARFCRRCGSRQG